MEDKELDDELKQEIDKEITTAYIAGLVDGSATPKVRISKDNQYKFGYSFKPQIVMRREQPYGIQILDDWATKNSVFASVNKYEDRFEFKIGKREHIERFIELMLPYVQDKFEAFQILNEDILPLLEDDYDKESKENFVETVKKIDAFNKEVPNVGASKYDAEYFKEEWDLD